MCCKCFLLAMRSSSEVTAFNLAFNILVIAKGSSSATCSTSSIAAVAFQNGQHDLYEHS